MTKERLQVEGYYLQTNRFYQECLPKYARPEWIPLWFSTQILQLMICIHGHVPSSRRQIVGSALEKDEFHLVYCWFTYQIDDSCAELIIGLLLSNTYQWRWSNPISFIFSFSTIDKNECSYHFSINSVNS